MTLTIEQIYSNYYNYLLGHAIGYCSSIDEAKDVVQLSLIKAWKNLNKYNPEKSSIATWLYKIMKNTALDKIRARKNNVRSDEVEWEIFTSPCINTDTMDLKMNLNKVRLKYRLYIYLNYIEGYTHDEIAERTDTPLGTVKSRIRLGLRDLQQIYK